MKNLLKVIFAAVLVCTAAASCTKDETQSAADGRVQVSVTGQICDPAIAGDTKASASTVVKLTWAGDETVHAYAGDTKVGELKASLYKSDKQYATLTGTLENVPQGTTVITLVHSNKPVNFEGGKATVDLSSQDGTLSFVVYGTINYNGTGIANELVKFNFATSTVLLTGTGIGTSGTATARINKVNNVCAITPSATDAPAIAGESEGNINMATAGISVSGDGRFTMNVALAPDASGATTTGRTVEVAMDGKTYKSAYTATKMTQGTAYISVYAFTEILPYVVIPAKYDGETVTELKWYRQNLAISPSGNKSWKGGNSSAVKVPGTGEDVINGDYFQWAASYAGYNITDEADKKPENLLVYTSFTSKACGDGADAFSCKSGKQFSKSNAPYYDGSKYTKYTKDDSKTVLERTDVNDDVANIILGGSWRMPTSAEFQAMYDATNWTWNATDQGYYVTEKEVPLATDKSNALLFFPAAGYGYHICLYGADSSGFYWSSSPVSGYPYIAYYVCFCSSFVDPQSANDRYSGFTVRPVSD